MTFRTLGRRLFATVLLATLATSGSAKTAYRHTTVGNIDVVSSMPEVRTSRFLHELVGLRKIIEDLLDSPVSQSSTQVVVFGSQTEMDELFPPKEIAWTTIITKWQAVTSPQGDTFAIINEWPNGKAFREGALKEYAANLINRTLPNCPYWIYEGLASFLCTLEYRDGKMHLGERRMEREHAVTIYTERIPLTETLDKVWMSRDVPALWHLWLTEDYQGNRLKIRRLAQLMREGAPGNSATVAQVFGRSPAEMQDALYKDMRRAHELTVDLPAPTADLVGGLPYQPATPFEIAVARNHVVVSLQQRPPGLAASLRELAAANPASPRPLELLARLATVEAASPAGIIGQPDPNEIPAAAAPYWLEACAKNTGNPYAYLVALRTPLEPRSTQLDLQPSLSAERVSALRQLADRCTTLNPGDVDAHLWGAWIEALAPAPDGTRLKAIEQTHARYLRPGVLIPLAIAHLRLAQPAEASPLLDEYQRRLGNRAQNQAVVDVLRQRIAEASPLK